MSAHNKQNLTAEITEGSKLKSFNVEINNMNIRQEMLYKLQLNVKDNGMTGMITYSDVENVNELGTMTTGIITIEYVDALNMKYVGNFAITKVDVSRTKKNIISTIVYFEEIAISTMRKTFLGVGFKDVHFSEVIIQMCELLGIPINVNYNETKPKLESFVIPSNISFYDFLVKQLEIFNMRMYSTKSGLVVSDKDYLSYGNFGETGDKPFVQGANKNNLFFNILEYKGVVSNPRMLATIPTTLVETIQDKSVLTLDSVEASIKSVYDRQKLNGTFGTKDSTIVSANQNIGRKAQSSISFTLVDGVDTNYADTINQSQKINIIVEGLNIDRIYTLVNVTLERAPNTKNSNGDEVFSGKFIVVGYQDLIVGGVFSQKLTLQRSDFMGGNPNV